jgi:4a-hydroxytetrahydrobiopterin dehydratase
MVKALSEAEIAEALNLVPQWKREGQEITRSFTLPTFREAIGFVNRVAEHADKVDHHPDILVQYQKVTLRLSTHDAGGLTQRDFSSPKSRTSLLRTHEGPLPWAWGHGTSPPHAH